MTAMMAAAARHRDHLAARYRWTLTYIAVVCTVILVLLIVEAR